MPLLKPKIHQMVERTDSIDSIQMEFNQIFEAMFPKAAEKLIDHDKESMSELDEEILDELIKVNFVF